MRNFLLERKLSKSSILYLHFRLIYTFLPRTWFLITTTFILCLWRSWFSRFSQISLQSSSNIHLSTRNFLHIEYFRCIKYKLSRLCDNILKTIFLYLLFLLFCWCLLFLWFLFTLSRWFVRFLWFRFHHLHQHLLLLVYLLLLVVQLLTNHLHTLTLLLTCYLTRTILWLYILLGS